MTANQDQAKIILNDNILPEPFYLTHKVNTDNIPALQNTDAPRHIELHEDHFLRGVVQRGEPDSTDLFPPEERQKDYVHAFVEGRYLDPVSQLGKLFLRYELVQQVNDLKKIKNLKSELPEQVAGVQTTLDHAHEVILPDDLETMQTGLNQVRLYAKNNYLLLPPAALMGKPAYELLQQQARDNRLVTPLYKTFEAIDRSFANPSLMGRTYDELTSIYLSLNRQ